MNKGQMQQVLDALERNVQHKYPEETRKAVDLGQQAIAIMKAAVDAPEVEPVATVIGRDQYQEMGWELDRQLPVNTKLYAAPQERTPKPAQPAQKTLQAVLEDWEKWAFSTGLDERNHDLCAALTDIRASTDAVDAALVDVLKAAQAAPTKCNMSCYADPWGLCKCQPQAAPTGAKT